MDLVNVTSCTGPILTGAGTAPVPIDVIASDEVPLLLTGSRHTASLISYTTSGSNPAMTVHDVVTFLAELRRLPDRLVCPWAVVHDE